MEQCTNDMRVVKSQLTSCLDLLALMASHARGMRLTDVAENLGAPKSSTQRLLEHLADEGWIEQDNHTSQYRLTARLAVLGQRYVESAGIRNIAEALLGRLAADTGELARLTVLDSKRLVWIGSAQGAPYGLRYEPAMGTAIVSYATANGKAWLATLSDTDAVAIATADGLGRRKKDTTIGPNAHRTTVALVADLAATRKRGYAIADGEAEQGVAALAVAIHAPGGGAVLGTASIAGPVIRVTRERYPAIVASLRAIATDLSLAWPGIAARELPPRRRRA